MSNIAIYHNPACGRSRNVMEELVKFTLLTRDCAGYLVDRYSERERRESAQALSLRVSAASRNWNAAKPYTDHHDDGPGPDPFVGIFVLSFSRSGRADQPCRGGGAAGGSRHGASGGAADWPSRRPLFSYLESTFGWSETCMV